MLKQISVIGGGLGGLVFAQGMRLLAGYQVVVYERDTSPSHRSQGYQIGLNSDGLGALNVLSLPGFSELIHENPLYGFMMTDDQLEGLVRFPVQKVGTQPTKMSLVNRFRLRDILATGITIQWDKKFVKHVETPEGVVAHFEDGSTAVSSLLVGADGVNSKVRAQYRPDLVLQKTGITSIAGFFPTAVDGQNELPKLKDIVKLNLGRALMPDTHTMLFMRFIANDGQENLLWSLSYDTEKVKAKYGELSAAATSSNEALMQELIKRMQALKTSPELSRMLSLTPAANLLLPTETLTLSPSTTDAHIRPSSLPPTHHRVLLLGDAAHAMTTHAGKGANTAFTDALFLSRKILGRDGCNVDDPSSWAKLHAEYEKHLFSNGLKAVKESFENTQRIHVQDRAVGNAFLKGMGYVVKTWNLLTKGKFSL